MLEKMSNKNSRWFVVAQLHMILRYTHIIAMLRMRK